jgi:hypothetical protein
LSFNVLALSLLIYFVSLDLTVGGLILAGNASWRPTPDHRELRRRILAALPWTAASWLLAAGAVLVVLSAGDSASGGTMVLPQRAGRDLVPRLLHVCLAALAVPGFAVAYSSLLMRRSDPAFSRWLARHGLVWFVLGSAMNLPIGGAWLVKLPRPVIERLEGGDTIAMAAISAGVIAAIFALGFGAMAAVVSEPRGYLHATSVSLLVTLVSMVVVREQLRVPAFGGAPDAMRSLGAAALLVSALLSLWRGGSRFVVRP